MKEERKSSRQAKVVIVGAGIVGTTYAYALLMRGVAREMVLIDLNTRLAEGEAMDLTQGLPFVSPAIVRAGDYKDCLDAQLVVITAGAAQKKGETRLDLVKKNAAIFQDIIPKVNNYLEDGIILVVTNPVDILTRLTQDISTQPKERIIGSGTVLDSSRLRSLLSAHCQVDARNVHAYIIGEHGDSEVPVWSLVNIGGALLGEYCALCGRDCVPQQRQALFEQVRNAAYQIIERKGATNYAIGLAALRITEAILRDERSILPVSVRLDGYLGIKDVCLSIPVILGAEGVINKLYLTLNKEEEAALKASAKILEETYQNL